MYKKDSTKQKQVNVQLITIEDNGEIKPFTLDKNIANGLIQYAIYKYGINKEKELNQKKLNKIKKT
jgi:hypothetical protein